MAKGFLVVKGILPTKLHFINLQQCSQFENFAREKCMIHSISKTNFTKTGDGDHHVLDLAWFVWFP